MIMKPYTTLKTPIVTKRTIYFGGQQGQLKMVHPPIVSWSYAKGGDF